MTKNRLNWSSPSLGISKQTDVQADFSFYNMYKDITHS